MARRQTEGTNALQDRTTAAFAGAIHIPPVVVADDYRLHVGDSGTWLYAVPDASTRSVEVPVDFYLREGQVENTDDLDVVMAFVRAWGIPVSPRNADLVHEGAELAQRAKDMDLLAEGLERFDEGREAAAIELGWISAEQPPDRMIADVAVFYEAHWERERLWRRLFNVYEVVHRLDQMWLFADCVKDETLDDVGIAATILHVNAALSVFAPRLEVPGLAPIPLTVYNAAAAQLANDVYSGATLQTCQNETCRRPFTKQRGRAEYGAYRSKGVLYCSNNCSLAQAQRELRRRRRKEQNNA